MLLPPLFTVGISCAGFELIPSVSPRSRSLPLIAGAAAVCLNAYLIPYPPPSSFERGLERLAPGLVDRLRDADGGSISW